MSPQHETKDSNTKYNYSEGTVRVSSGKSVKDKLVPDFYKLCHSPMTGFYLEIIPPFKVPNKVYGNLESRSQRISQTYRSVENKNLGVLLDGVKGCGKTLLMNSLCRDMVYKYKVPVISISDKFSGGEFVSFINSIDQDCVVAFDEFEKVYGGNDSSSSSMPSILELLDGQSCSHKMFLMTCNNSYQVSSFLMNRPSRIRYRYKYTFLQSDVISEVVADQIEDKDRIQEVERLLSAVGDITFDIAIAVISEINMYPEDKLSDIFDRMNVDFTSTREILEITLYNKGLMIPAEDVLLDNYSTENKEKRLYCGRLKGVNSFEVSHYSCDDEDEVIVDEDLIFSWVDVDLKNSDYTKDIYAFSQGEYTLVIRKQEFKPLTFSDAFFRS